MQIKVTIHSTGTGLCSLTGKESDGMTVTFDDGTLKESFLSWKAFRQLLSMKAGCETAGMKVPLATSVGPEAATM